MLQHGDFTALAKDYVNRPGYSRDALRCLIRHTGVHVNGARVADVGAGTGKLTQLLADCGLAGHAVEPNDAMRAEAARLAAGGSGFEWRAGAAEDTGLPDGCVDWVCMASSFHWTDAPVALREFHRILRPHGHLTVLWNPRDLDGDAFQRHIDERIRAMVPGLKRRSSGSAAYTETVEQTLRTDALFGHVVFVEAPHAERMSRARYLAVWRSVNDIRVQAGEERWADIMTMIEDETEGLDDIVVGYRTRAWTVRAL